MLAVPWLVTLGGLMLKLALAGRLRIEKVTWPVVPVLL
jgi:hypothetical protein